MENAMNKTATLLGAAGLGAGLVFLMDPVSGRRRRALIRDKAVRVLNRSQWGMGKVARDASNRARGIVAEASHIVQRNESDDETLLERVRSKIGRLASHPRAIDVSVSNGNVTLFGPVLRDELDRVIHGVKEVRGVREVENMLEPHDEADVSSLQGGRERRELAEWRQTNWSPTMRFLAGASGAAMLGYALARRDRWSAALMPAGVGCLVRAIANRQMREIMPIGRSGLRHPIPV